MRIIKDLYQPQDQQLMVKAKKVEASHKDYLYQSNKKDWNLVLTENLWINSNNNNNFKHMNPSTILET